MVGVLLLMGGNLTLSYAERYVPSGIAALLVASIALWFLILDALILGDHPITARGLFGLVMGVSGLVVCSGLSSPPAARSAGKKCGGRWH